MNYKEVLEENNKIIIKGVKDFNIKQILECGQCFRWEKISDTNYIVVAFRRVIEIMQDGDDVIIYNTNLTDFNEIWKNYFDLDRDYKYIKEELSKDELLNKMNLKGIHNVNNIMFVLEASNILGLVCSKR